MAAVAKPTLVKLETSSEAMSAAKARELKSAYPSELSAMSEDTPISAHPLSAGPYTAPILPPTAYVDFLRSMNLVSPVSAASPSPRSTPTAQPSLSRTQSGSTASIASTPATPPSTADSSSDRNDRSCKSDPEPLKRPHVKMEEEDEEQDKRQTAQQQQQRPQPADAVSNRKAKEVRRRPAKIGPASAPASGPTTPALPMSAPPRPMSFPSLEIPVSPARSAAADYSPQDSVAESPFSATFSATSPGFPYSVEMAKIKARWDPASRAARKTVRYRTVITRTITTYTPIISAAPKSKKRRLAE